MGNYMHIATRASGSKAEAGVIHALAEIRPDWLDAVDNIEYRTPLHMAAFSGYAMYADALLENGASADMKDYEGNTAVHLAARNSDIDCLIALLRYNAPTDSLNAL